MNRKKMIITAVVLLLLVVAGGILAYFTDTDTETNTFTIGNVKIDLVEDNWNATSAQGILPGTEVSKDPKVSNVGTAGAYMFLKVQEPCYGGTPVFKFNDEDDEVNEGWVPVGNERVCESNTGVSTATTIYAYGSSSAMTEVTANSSTGTLFDSVILDSTLDKTALTALVGGDFDDPQAINIVVDAYGIQKDNVTGTPSAIWTANFGS